MKPIPMLAVDLIEDLAEAYPVKAHKWDTPHEQIIWENAQASLVLGLKYQLKRHKESELEKMRKEQTG